MSNVTWTDWTAGVSNTAPDNALPTDKYKRVIGLRDAVNVDVLTSGKLRRRTGIKQIVADAGAHSVFVAAGSLVWATANALKIKTGNDITTLLTSPKLAAPLSYVEVNGRTYFSNEQINGIITEDGEYEPWGIEPPSTAPTLDASAGKHHYQVTCTFVTASGEESGAPLAAQVLCGDVPSIRVSNIPQSSDTRVVATRLYATNIDDGNFQKVMDVPAGITIATLTGYFASGAMLKTQFMQPPPPGQLLEYNNGVIYIASGNNVYRTQPLRYNMYDPMEDFYMYPARVTLLKSVPDGMYISSDQVYFVSGMGTDAVQQLQLLTGRAIEGAATRLPDGEEIVFVTDRGFVKGAAGGQVVNLTEDKMALDFYPRGALGYTERDGHKALLAVFADGQENPAVSDDFRTEDKARKAART